MKRLILILPLLLSFETFAQCANTCGVNLLPNPGFEIPTSSCTTADIQLYNSQTPVQGWFGTDDYPSAGSSPDYFSPCAGSTNSANNVCFNGSGRVGVFTKTSFSLGREYVQAQLNAPLQAGKTYCFSMTVKSRVGSAGNILSSCDGMGAWIHNQGLINIQTMNGGNQFLGPGSMVNATPQVENPSGNLISSTCVIVTGTFCAQGNESWIVIGNFRDDANTQITGSNPSNYMYIEDATLLELCSPSIDLVASNAFLNCGESTTLTANSTFPSGTTYTWISPAGNSLSGLGPHTVNPTETTTYTIVASYTNGCGIQLDTASLEIEVGPCGIEAEIHDSVICQGDCHDLQVYNILGGTAPYDVQWFDASGTQIGTTSGPISVCPTTSTFYILQVVDATNDTLVDTLQITVYDYPVVNAGLDIQLCEGESIQLTGTTDIGAAQWLSNGLGNPIQVSPTTSTAYIYQSNNNGCISQDTVLITVNSLPTIDLSSTNITCNGANDGTITAAVVGLGNITYSWSPVTGSNTNSISNLPAGWEWLEVTDGNGCTAIDSVLITEPSPLEMTLSGNTSICEGTSTTLSVLATGGEPSYDYDWDNGIGNGTSYTISPTLNSTVMVSITDANQCTIDSTIQISVFAAPIANFDGGIQLCAGTDTTIVNTSTGASNYAWYINGSGPISTTNLSFSENNSGCYSIQLIAQNPQGCSDTITDNCAVEIQETPVSSVQPSSHLVFMDDPSVSLLNNSENGDSCVWFVENVLFHTGCEQLLNYNFSDLGVYEFEHFIYNDFGCVDSSKFTVEIREGLIYYVPNSFTPDGDEFNNTFQPIFSSGFDPTQFNLIIFDRWGEIVFESNDHLVGWDGTYHGKKATIGTYTWKIHFKDLYNDKQYEIVGSVNLLE